MLKEEETRHSDETNREPKTVSFIERINMKPVVALLCILLATLSVAQEPELTVDRSSPEKTIQAFTELFQKGLIENAMYCVLDFKPTDTMRKRVAQLSGLKFTLSAVISDVKINGVKATAKVVTTLTLDKPDQKQTFNDLVNLALNKGNWLIVTPKKMPEGKSFINNTVYVLSVDAAKAEKEKKDPSYVCLSNIRQVALAFAMLCSDSKDVFKVQADAWKKSILPYLKNTSFLTCPLDAKDVVSYSINPLVAGKALSAFAAPAKTVLLYEGKGGKLLFRHNGRAAVAFVDGHAELVDAAKAKTLRLKP
jgi:prepilin-type processing-associated H-X9-DG protein